MSRVKRHSPSAVENGRPAPSDRPEDYEASGLWSAKWSDYSPGGTFLLERRGSDTPTEKYRFDSERDGEGDLKVTPKEKELAKLRRSRPSGDWVEEFPRGRRAKTTTESCTVEDLPQGVIEYIAREDGVVLVGSLSSGVELIEQAGE